MSGYSLADQAQVRTDLGDGHAVIDLCEAALDDAGRLLRKVQIMAMQQLAHGASLTGDRTAVDRLIDQAPYRSGDSTRAGARSSRSPGRWHRSPSRADPRRMCRELNALERAMLQ
ncbi:hypothetical protein [Streptomyces albidochromogenes]|uniref:Uncharacterized protein n=1 Tax=Streptomyces albidochromogenes TaxID=329524 RepID=A0ABW6FF52_9ACTN